MLLHQASLAQLVERGTSNAEVTGSTPLGGSSLIAMVVNNCVKSPFARERVILVVEVVDVFGGRWWLRISIFGFCGGDPDR
jgi:hypothetical protein